MNKIAGYRKFLGLNQNEMASKLGISVQAYRKKENKKTPFKDSEKIVFKNELAKEHFPNIKIDDIFFWIWVAN